MLSTPLLASALVSCAALSRPAVMAREHLATTTTRTASISMQMAALLWDCDGVLADTERDGHRVSFNRVFSERSLGFEWGVEEYGKLCEVGGGKERMTAYFNARAGDRSFCLEFADTPPFPHMSHPVSPICQKLILQRARRGLARGLRDTDDSRSRQA
jgi:hypothetical protein